MADDLLQHPRSSRQARTAESEDAAAESLVQNAALLGDTREELRETRARIDGAGAEARELAADARALARDVERTRDAVDRAPGGGR